MIKELVWVFLLGAFPIAELRGAMPLGIFVFKLPPLIVYLVAVLGNFLIVPLLLIFLKHFSAFLMRKSYFFNRFLNYIFSRTRDHHFHKFERWEHWMLFALVAIPFPLTGAWTACVAAFLFDISFKKSLFVILLGLIVAGLIVLGLSELGNGAIGGLL
jgi:uncharacterized membrane protein